MPIAPAVLESLRLAKAVLLPEQHQSYAGIEQFDMDAGQSGSERCAEGSENGARIRTTTNYLPATGGSARPSG